jgi:hypothetical protein
MVPPPIPAQPPPILEIPVLEIARQTCCLPVPLIMNPRGRLTTRKLIVVAAGLAGTI